jgi:hypothetical protein
MTWRKPPHMLRGVWPKESKLSQTTHKYSGYTGENQPPCDAAGYMIGHHTWPIERKNAWFAGWNLGNCEAPK